MPKKEKIAVSAWLADFDGHDILNETVLQNLTDETGYEVKVPRYSREDIQRQLDADVGKAGGYINGEGPFVTALDIVDGIATMLKVDTPFKFGRGSRYRDAVAAIKAKGY